MIKKLILLLTILSILSPLNATTLTYNSKIEGQKNNPLICTTILEKSSQTISCTNETNKETLTLNNNTLISWSNEFSKDTYFNARIQNNHLILTGKNNSKKISKSKYIGETKWLQSQLLLMTPFILSNNSSIEFYMITGPMISKMKLEKIKQEPITINQNSYMAIKTQMNPTGLLGKLWKAVIYYDKETGKMLSYEAPSGPPGSKKTIITLVEN